MVLQVVTWGGRSEAPQVAKCPWQEDPSLLSQHGSTMMKLWLSSWSLLGEYKVKASWEKGLRASISLHLSMLKKLLFPWASPARSCWKKRKTSGREWDTWWNWPWPPGLSVWKKVLSKTEEDHGLDRYVAQLSSFFSCTFSARTTAPLPLERF